MLLLSDLLLITRRQGKVLTVLEDPLPLDQLTVQDITYTDGECMNVTLSVCGGTGDYPL